MTIRAAIPVLTLLTACAAPSGDGDLAPSADPPGDSPVEPGHHLTAPNGLDADGDGVPRGVDCNDLDATINPQADEVPRDGEDNDCDPGTSDVDDDGDGFSETEDCNDGDADRWLPHVDDTVLRSTTCLNRCTATVTAGLSITDADFDDGGQYTGPDYSCVTSTRSVSINGRFGIPPFSSLRTVEWNVYIQQLPVTNLSVFPALEEINMSLILWNMDELLTLRRSPDQTIKVHGLDLYNTTRLASLDGVELPASVDHHIRLRDMQALESIEALSGVRSVTEYVELSGLQALTSLSPLASLQSAPSLALYELDNITSLDGLGGSMTTPPGQVSLRDLPVLHDLSGLDQMVTDGTTSIQLEDLPALTALPTLSNIRVLKSLKLADLPNLESLEGLSALEELHGRLQIGTLPLIPDLAALENLHTLNGLTLTDVQTTAPNGLNRLTRIGTDGLLLILDSATTGLIGLEQIEEIDGDIWVFRTLPDLRGLSGVTTISGEIRIDTTDMDSLEGLTSLEFVAGGITINDNLELESLDGIPPTATINGPLVVEGNLALRTLFTAGSSPNFASDVTLTDNLLLTHIGDLQGVDGTLDNIRVTDNLSLIDLTGLEHISHITQELQVEGNTDLANTNGLSGLLSATRINIQSNPSLEDVGGFESMAELGELYIGYNPRLETIEGMPNLTDLHGPFWADINLSLVSAGVWPSLKTIQSISLSDNPRLSDVGVWGSGDCNAEWVSIAGNRSLEDLNGIEGIEAITGVDDLALWIGDNASLTDITAIEGFNLISGDVEIKDNIILTNAAAAAAVAKVGYIAGSVTITNNN